MHAKLRSLATLGLIALCGASEAAPPPPTLDVVAGTARIAWLQALRSDADDWINDLVPTRDGAVLAVGFLGRRDGAAPSDWRALAAKLQFDGTLAWSEEYGAGGGLDAFWTARERTDGSLLFAGFTSRVGPGGINAYLAHTDAQGALIKENGYGTPGYDRVTGLAASGDGFVAVGHAEGRDGRDLFYLGLDGSGVEAWRRTSAEPRANGALYVEPAGDGNFIVTGGTDASGDGDILVEKIAPDGRPLWRRTLGAPGTADTNHGLVVRADGSIVVVGYTASWGRGENDFLAAVLDRDGNVSSLQVFGGPGDEHVISAKPDAAGNVWLVGWSKAADADADVLLARIDARGAFADGLVLLGGAADDHGTALHALPGGDLLVGGYSRSLGGSGEEAFVLRLVAPVLASMAGFEVTVVE